jgi:hypothetical protein
MNERGLGHVGAGEFFNGNFTTGESEIFLMNLSIPLGTTCRTTFHLQISWQNRMLTTWKLKEPSSPLFVNCHGFGWVVWSWPDMQFFINCYSPSRYFCW